MVLDAETVPFIDVTAAEMLAALADDLRARGVTLVIARDVGRVRDVLRRSGDEEHVHRDVDEAIAAIESGPAEGAAGQ